MAMKMVLLKTYLYFSLKIFQKNPAICVSLFAVVYLPESHKKSIPGESVFFGPMKSTGRYSGTNMVFWVRYRGSFSSKDTQNKEKQQKLWEIGQGRESDEKLPSGNLT